MASAISLREARVRRRRERSANMARIASADTAPELAVRKLLYRLGYRFRLHRRSLPGTPDICFSGRKKVVFVHGCFWHRHEGCKRTTTPRTRTSFWKEKFQKNLVRDRANLQDLNQLGWSVMVVWECETADLEDLALRLAGFLGPHRVGRSRSVSRTGSTPLRVMNALTPAAAAIPRPSIAGAAATTPGTSTSFATSAS